jgi:hypothetical protein
MAWRYDELSTHVRENFIAAAASLQIVTKSQVRDGFWMIQTLGTEGEFSPFWFCLSTFAKLGGHERWLCSLPEDEFVVLSQVFHVDVAVGFDPIRVRFYG